MYCIPYAIYYLLYSVIHHLLYTTYYPLYITWHPCVYVVFWAPNYTSGLGTGRVRYYGPLPSLKGSELWAPVLKVVYNGLIIGL